jgi:hypothetical protein
MTTDYAPDAALCAAIVADGLSLGVRMFHTDIEAPSPRPDTPSYDSFASLGFRRPYTRRHWTTAWTGAKPAQSQPARPSTSRATATAGRSTVSTTKSSTPAVSNTPSR